MSGLKFDFSNLVKGLSEMDEKVTRASNLYAETAAQTMIGEAKRNAKWIDRTGNSRQTMDTNVVKLPNKVQIQLRGNTPHFKYLELCHEKKNAILWPTIQKNAATVIKGWAKVIWK
ncbi:MAG: hypothetical protein RSF37_14625 [Clostridium sp.]|uniref:hypothetical protein n=1 Tax=Clostridium sp. TaxID=1506 RepID=UPI002FC8185F